MREWFAQIINLVKQGLPLYVTAACTGLAFLALPPGAPDWLGATKISKEYRWAFGLAFVFFGLLSFCYSMRWIFSTHTGRQTFDSLIAILAKWQVGRKFDNLTPKERFLVLAVIESHERKFSYPFERATIQSLTNKGWVEYSGYRNRAGGRFEIRWIKCVALRISERMSDQNGIALATRTRRKLGKSETRLITPLNLGDIRTEQTLDLAKISCQFGTES